MSRAWFWPLVIAATLLLSLAVGSALSVVMLYLLDDPAQLNPNSDDSVIVYSYYIDVHPALYVSAGLVAALGAFLFVLAARLR